MDASFELPEHPVVMAPQDSGAELFSVTQILADLLLPTRQLPERAGLIFSGSLLTHFDGCQGDNFLALCAASPAPDGGVLGFWMHGRAAALLAAERTPCSLWIPLRCTKPTARRGLRSYRMPLISQHSASRSPPIWGMRQPQATPDLKIIGFEERGWGQDVIVLQKNAWPMMRPS